jgi:hypothetical protein
MVRWIDGFYSGLAASVTSAAFYAVAATAWVHGDSAAAAFAQIARALPGLHAAPAAWPEAGLGLVLYLLAGSALGIAYALVARGRRSMWRAPTSVLWGIAYGLVVWWFGADVLVPVLGASDFRPLWEGVTATVLFYGVVLSELTTFACRRAAAAP